MSRLEEYLKEVKESVEASYSIGTQTPAFRTDVEVLLKMNTMLLDGLKYLGQLSYDKEIDWEKLEALIPTKEGEL